MFTLGSEEAVKEEYPPQKKKKKKKKITLGEIVCLEDSLVQIPPLLAKPVLPPPFSVNYVI